MKHLPKILLIDDEVDYIRSLTVLLKTKGFDVYSLLSGEAALKTTRSFRPDVIVLDVRLGNEDGEKICQQIRSDNDIKHVSIILHSAFPDMEDYYKICGADDFILKPTNIDQLISRINHQLK